MTTPRNRKKNESNGGHVHTTLPPEAEQYLRYPFTRQDLEKLYCRFEREDGDNNGTLNKEEFIAILHLKKGPFTDRLFQAFDDNDDGVISFKEFVENLCALHQRATPEDSLNFAKKLYGVNDTVSKEEMMKMLQTDMEQNNVRISEESIAEAVNALFSQHADENGRLDLGKLMEATGMNAKRNLSLDIRASTIGGLLKDDKQINHDAHCCYEHEKPDIERTRDSWKKRWKKTYVVYHYARVHPTVIIWLAIYLGITAGMFPVGMTTIEPGEREFFGWGIVLAKGFRVVLYYNVPLIFLLMCRTIMAWLRRSKFLTEIFPFDSNITFHRIVGWVIIIAALGHTIGHYKDFYEIANNPLPVVNAILRTPLDSPKSWGTLLFTTISGVTGHLMWLCLLLMYPLTFFRRKNFEVFWASHHLYIVFIVLLLIHGSGQLLTWPMFYLIFAVPGFLFLFERLFRLFKAAAKTEVIVAKPLLDEVTLLRVTKPRVMRKVYPGQWVWIRCRNISSFEWHPFTLTSAPHEEFLEIHAKAVGAWTKSLYELVVEQSKDPKEEKLESGKSFNLKIDVDGPFGAPAQNFKNYNTVILFAGGIGVTPFASIIKHLLHKMKVKREYPVQKVLFYWSARSQKNFTWFSEVIKEAEEFNEIRPNTFSVELFFTGATKEDDIRSVMLTSVLNYHYEEKQECLVSGLGSRIRFNRPNLNKILDGVAKEHPNEKKIGIFYCGPPVLARGLLHECHAVNRKYDQPKFNFLKENF